MSSIPSQVSGARGFTHVLVTYFSTFGVPDEASGDVGPEFNDKETAVAVPHLSSTYQPSLSIRAEVAIKT